MDSFRPNWAFYPLHGIEIIPDDTPIVHSLMFDDATIISKDEIDKVLLFFDQTDKDKLFNIRMHLQMVGQQGDSIMIVRQPEGNIDTIREQLDYRVVEIVSAISNILLMYSNYHWTCCLADENYNIRHMMSIILHPKEGFKQSIEKIATRSWFFRTPNPPFRITRKDLQKKLFSNEFQHLSAYIFTPFSLLKKRGLKQTIKEKISTASIHLYRCINSSTPELQLVGAVTSIEVLLKNKQEKYEQIGIRLERLISSYAFNFYAANKVFQDRHNCVHAGQEVAKEYAYLAIRLATNCLVNYSTYVQNFSNSEQILNHLDLLDDIQKLIKKHKASKLFETFSTDSLINPPSDIIDPLPFYLSNYALGSYLQEHKTEEQKMIFATYTCVLSVFRKLSIEESFIQLIQACIYSPLPFDQFSTFSLFYEDNKESLEATAHEKTEQMRNSDWIWRVYKYKWEKDN